MPGSRTDGVVERVRSEPIRESSVQIAWISAHSAPMNPSSPPLRRLADEVRPETLAAIVRHYKERKSKCSVQPLVEDDRFAFVKFVPELQVEATGFTLLAVDAPALSPDDAGRPLLILDSTWRYLPAMERAILGNPPARSLPRELETAYARTSKIEDDPDGGLASIEALYAALRILGHRDDALLDDYFWRDPFLENCERAGLRD